MENKKWLLLRAVEGNGDLIGPGDWMETEWLIYSDGSYLIISKFKYIPQKNEGPVEGHKKILTNSNMPSPIKRRNIGNMDEKSFVKIQKLLKRDLSVNLSLNKHTCDGEGWKFEVFKEDGSILKTSGKMYYIYGNTTLEKIARLLPSDGNSYRSNAYIAIEDKESRISKFRNIVKSVAYAIKSLQGIYEDDE